MAQIGKMGLGTDRPLGVLLGQSGLGTDVDARVLEEADGEAMRWENLHGWGSSVNLMVDVSDLLMLSGLKPNVVILGLSPVLLVGTNFVIQHPLLARQQGKWIKPWIWTYNNRLVVNHGTRLITNRIKLWLCRRFGFGLPAIYPPKPDTAPPTRRRVPRESARAEALRLETYEKVGWFDPGHYSPSSSNSRSLVKIIRDCRRLGATVGIVLMPETSLMRRLTPAEAVDLFAEINRIDFAEDPVPVYNLRSCVPDEMFHDVIHVNIDAMNAVSTLVARCVKDLLSAHPAPDRLHPCEDSPRTLTAGPGPGLKGP